MDENTPQMVLVDIPAEFADAGFIAGIKTEDGKLDLNKALKKMQNQESALGKRALPTSDSSDTEQDEFIVKMRENTKGANFDELFDNSVSADALKAALKEAGVLPKQARQIVAAYKKDLVQQYDEEAFKKMVAESLTKEELETAKKALSSDEWDAIFNNSNKESLGRLKLAASLGKRIVGEEKGIGSGTPSGGTGNFEKKGMCPEYMNEMKAARGRNASQSELDAIMTKYGWNHQTSSWDE